MQHRAVMRVYPRWVPRLSRVYSHLIHSIEYHFLGHWWKNRDTEDSLSWLPQGQLGMVNRLVKISFHTSDQFSKNGRWSDAAKRCSFMTNHSKQGPSQATAVPSSSLRTPWREVTSLPRGLAPRFGKDGWKRSDSTQYPESNKFPHCPSSLQENCLQWYRHEKADSCPPPSPSTSIPAHL